MQVPAARRLRLLRAVASIGALSLGAATALAQDAAAPPAAPPVPPPAAAPAAPAAPPADVPATEGALVAPAREETDAEDPAAKTPPHRYVEVASESVMSMRTALTKGLDELKDARERKDAVQLTCVNEQVTAMKGILRVSEDAIVSLQEASAANDTERARHEFRKIQVSK